MLSILYFSFDSLGKCLILQHAMLRFQKPLLHQWGKLPVLAQFRLSRSETPLHIPRKSGIGLQTVFLLLYGFPYCVLKTILQIQESMLLSLQNGPRMQCRELQFSFLYLLPVR